MTLSVTDTLCTKCGLCCDGTLLADVELASRSEATGLEILGLAIEEDDDGRGLLLLPCRALKGRRCSIYAHRPECCRTFECRLLQDVKRGAVSVERAGQQVADAVQQVERVTELIAELGTFDEHLSLKERCAEALATETDGTPGADRSRRELEAAMSAVERMIEKTFLAGSKRP